jgi:hypothetical protein
MERVAQCACGSLKAITTEEPLSTYVCHCLSCQRRTGTIVHTGVYASKAKFRAEGVHTVYARRSDSGSEVRFYFCPTCGTSVYWDSTKYPDTIGIAAGCFADPSLPPPSRSVWTETKHEWLKLPDSIEVLPKGFNLDGTPMV